MSTSDFSLKFKTPNGKTYELSELTEEDTIEYVKEKMREIHGIPINKSNYFFQNKKLSDYKTLEECCLKNNTELKLIIQA